MQNLYKKPRPSLRHNGFIYLQIASYKFKFRQTYVLYKSVVCGNTFSIERILYYFHCVFYVNVIYIFMYNIYKRIIHNLICSDALCMRNNVQCTFYIMFCKFMHFNKIFKTIFEYIRKKFRFVHTNTFCEYRKNYAHRLACILFFVICTKLPKVKLAGV